MIKTKLAQALKPKRQRLPAPASGAQLGSVLAMTLLLLVVMSVLAAFALKHAITGEQIAKSMRTHSVALQSAETALRQCENAVKTGSSKVGGNTLVINDMPDTLASGSRPEQWKLRANWTAQANLSTEIPLSLSVGANMRPKPAPRCMVEQFRLPRLDPDPTLSDPYLITAVGYSPDYQSDASGNPLAGSEAWVQSIFRP